jgi:cytidylate kinase
MNQQLIVAVSREFASGGREIAKILACQLGIGYFDRNLLDEIAAEKLGDVEKLRKYDEVPRVFLRRTVRGMTSSPEENVAQVQFDYMTKLADSGQSFVIVGRCAAEVLSEYPGLVKIFVLADEESKIDRICESREVNRDEAARLHNNGWSYSKIAKLYGVTNDAIAKTVKAWGEEREDET